MKSLSSLVLIASIISTARYLRGSCRSQHLLLKCRAVQKQSFLIRMHFLCILNLLKVRLGLAYNYGPIVFFKFLPRF